MRGDEGAVPVGLPRPVTCTGGAFHTIRVEEEGEEEGG